jgi:iron complex transport system ATP-binding protein
MSGIIEVENLSFGYTQQSTVLKNVSFEVKPGTFLVVAGPNGAGKSTLLNLLCGTLKPQSGVIRIDSKAIESYSSATGKTEALAKKVAVVHQEFVPIFGFSVIETVLMARTPYFDKFGFERQADRQIVNEALQATDTARFAMRPLGNLSGGERQRVFIARALAQDTPVLLLDEPTSFLDLKHQVKIYDLLKAAQLEKGRTIVTVTHDINLAAQYCDEILLLGGQPNGTKTDRNYSIGSTKDVFSPEQIEKAFGVKTFAGEVGQEKFYLPLGKFAKDITKISGKPNSNQFK